MGGLAVDCQTEWRYALQFGFGNRLPHVLEAITAFIIVDVVRLAIGKHDQQPVFDRLTHQQHARMTECGA